MSKIKFYCKVIIYLKNVTISYYLLLKIYRRTYGESKYGSRENHEVYRKLFN